MEIENKRKDESFLNEKIVEPIKGYFRRNYGVLAGLIVLCILLTITSDAFFQVNNLINVLRQISINAILAVCLTFAILIGQIDLSVGSIVAASGCFSIVLLADGSPLWLALLVGILSGAAFGFINGIFVSRTKIPSFIVTLATQTAIRGIAYISTGGYPVSSNNDVFNEIGNGYLGKIPVPVIIMIAILLFAAVTLGRTKFGRHMYAIGGNREAAKYSGIDVKNVELIVFIISGILAAIAGIILAARLYSGQPTVGTGYEGDAIAAAVLGGTSFAGGIGTIGGTLLGALVIGVLNNGLNLLQVSFYYQLVVKGIVIIAAVFFDTMKKDLIKKKKK